MKASFSLDEHTWELRKDCIPDELKDVQPDRWIGWRFQTRERGKPGKIPIDLSTGEPADVTAPNVGTEFYFASHYHENGTMLDYMPNVYEDNYTEGLGWVFTDEEPYVGLDLDNCVHEDGTIDMWALYIINRVDSYTEYSPSGTGIHVICKGSLPEGNCRRNDVEMYERDRFFTVTGDHYPSAPRKLNYAGDVLADLYNEFIKPESADAQPIVTGGGNEIASPTSTEVPDDQLLAKAKAAKNGYRFRRLWKGDTTGYPSHSEADQALCNHLAFWTAYNPGQMDRLFRRSGLMRTKWDEQRGKTTYGDLTITAAANVVDNYYSPDYGK